MTYSNETSCRIQAELRNVPDRRRRTRVSAVFPVDVRIRDARYVMQSEDISMKGLRLRACAQAPEILEGEACSIRIDLSGNVRIRCRGRVVRAWDGFWAVDFVEIESADFQHLQNIVRFHAKEPDLIEHEVCTSAAFTGCLEDD